MKSFKEIRKEIAEENTVIENDENPIYENTKEACEDILEAIEEDIKDDTERDPFNYEYNWTYRFGLRDKSGTDELSNMIVKELDKADYNDCSCMFIHDQEKDEYSITIQMFLYPFTQEEKKKLKIAERTEKIPYFAFGLGLRLFLLLSLLCTFNILTSMSTRIILLIIVLTMVSSLIIACIACSKAQKIIKEKW